MAQNSNNLTASTQGLWAAAVFGHVAIHNLAGQRGHSMEINPSNCKEEITQTPHPRDL